MSEPRYRPSIFEPALYLFFWFFQTWGWIIFFLFLGWKFLGCWLPEPMEIDESSISQVMEYSIVIRYHEMG